MSRFLKRYVPLWAVILIAIASAGLAAYGATLWFTARVPTSVSGVTVTGFYLVYGNATASSPISQTCPVSGTTATCSSVLLTTNMASTTESANYTGEFILTVTPTGTLYTVSCDSSNPAAVSCQTPSISTFSTGASQTFPTPMVQAVAPGTATVSFTVSTG